MLTQEVRLQADPLQDVLWHTQHGVHRFHLLFSEEGQARHSEQGVKGIHHVSRSVSEAARLLVLTGQDEGAQLGFVDPVDAADDFE